MSTISVQTDVIDEMVVYCPECDGLHVVPKGYAFKDEVGEFYLVFESNSFKSHKMYLVGEL